MSNPTRRGTLIESKWKYGTRLWTLAMESDIDAALKQEFILVKAFDTCPNPECENNPEFGPCPTCHDRRRVWRPELVTRIAKVLYRNYEECGDAYAARVWRDSISHPDIDVHEAAQVVVREFEVAACKALDTLGFTRKEES